jgi:hypothetical protein
MDLPGLLDQVMELERKVTDMRVGDPRLADVGVRIDDIERDLEHVRGMARPLVPDGSGIPSVTDETATSLEGALRSLRSAVSSKR